METLDQPKAALRLVYGAEDLDRRLGREVIERPAELSARCHGRLVRDGRTSWVTLDAERRIYIKTYDYPSLRAQGRGILRNTFLAPSRGRREWHALEWLRGRGFGGPRPLALFEARRLGFLRRAVLVTEAFEGKNLVEILPGLPPAGRDALLAEVCAFVRRLHRAGFRDRNLDLHNLLARREGDAWTLAKIDSPRHRLVRPGPAEDGLARGDWARLRRSCAELGVTLPIAPDP